MYIYTHVGMYTCPSITRGCLDIPYPRKGSHWMSRLVIPIFKKKQPHHGYPTGSGLTFHATQTLHHPWSTNMIYAPPAARAYHSRPITPCLTYLPASYRHAPLATRMSSETGTAQTTETRSLDSDDDLIHPTHTVWLLYICNGYVSRNRTLGCDGYYYRLAIKLAVILALSRI
jgi:hypothetical protein